MKNPDEEYKKVIKNVIKQYYNNLISIGEATTQLATAYKKCYRINIKEELK